MNIVKRGSIHFKEPKGFGTLSYKNFNVDFTNSITIFGKGHIHNAILFTMYDNAPIIIKATGISILCRRTHDDATNIDAKLNNSLFELNIVKAGNYVTPTTKTGAISDSHEIMPNSAEGNDIDVSGSNALIFCQVGTTAKKLTPGSQTGIWGSANNSGVLYDDIWDTHAERPGNNNPYNNGTGLDASVSSLHKARIIGISLITGNDYGTWTTITDTQTDSTTYSKKVWRDPSYLQLLHNQEATRNDYGLAEHGSAFTSTDATTSDDLTEAGHYYPDLALMHSADVGAGTTPDRAESQDADVWKWEHVAHDTFASTFFGTSYYAGQLGKEIQNPYGSSSIADQHRVAGAVQTAYDSNSATVYETDPGADIQLEFSDEATNDQDGGGDAVLPQTIRQFEVDYNTGGVDDPDHLIDSNDQISARYSIDFNHTAHGGDLNAIGDIDNSIGDNLAKALATDFGNPDDAFSEVATAVQSAFTHVRLFDKAGNQMFTKDIGSGFDNIDPITVAQVKQGSYTAITYDILNGATNINPGSASFADDSSTRERIWQTTIQLKFDNVKKIGNSYPANNPHTIKFYNGISALADASNPNFLFSITLADSLAVNKYNTQNPFQDPQPDSSSFEDFSDGRDLPFFEAGVEEGRWEDENNLVVNLTLYTG